MTNRAALRVGAVLMSTGVLLLLLPLTWIEAQLGESPDGGDGSLERWLGVAPLAFGLALAVPAWLRRRRSSTRLREAGATR